MSVKILRGIQVISDGSGQRSKSTGKIQVLFDDTFWQLTNDGDTFSNGFIFMLL